MATEAKGAGRPARIITTFLRGELQIGSDLPSSLALVFLLRKCRWDSDREEGVTVVLSGVGGAESISLDAGMRPSYQDN